MKRLWTWLDGHKTEIGGTIVALSVMIPELITTLGIDPANTDTTAGTIAGLLIIGIGWLHKAAKGLGWAKPVKYVK